MTSTLNRSSREIRKNFLDFFKSQQHTIVPSSSLLPDSPNLLFTNAGMNQFVPIFLGQKKPDVSKWAGAIPRSDARAADTQKCIRAGGKHNDLDDVGFDTYHHTFFEMLGNWSFGDYFSKEAIDWAWELVVRLWQFPANRLYATVFCPYLGKPGWEEKWRMELEQVLVLAMTSPDFIAPHSNVSPFEVSDQEAAMYWAKKFTGARCDPRIHIIPGNRKDNFWMMGETGPCGPCSELHVDLTPKGDSRGALVNQGDPRCIEIWNLVFIQFNAEPGNKYSLLPSRHVDTGMGFERVTSIIQGTKGFKDFASAKISNYETDIFRPIFDRLEKMSGRKYGSTLPPADLSTINSQQSTDVAFRVIADHIRALSFAIADGIQPGNNDRNYVLRRILRRAVRYGRTLGFHEPFFHQLVDVVAETMGEVFPEINANKGRVQDVIQREEEAFNRTLDNGIDLFDEYLKEKYEGKAGAAADGTRMLSGQLPGDFAFKLYDTYGFPIDLTELMARERGLTVDKASFEKLMEEQRTRARSAQKKEVITMADTAALSAAPDGGEAAPVVTRFVGFDQLETIAHVQKIATIKDKTVVLLDRSPCYAEMGGQVGDTGEILLNPAGAAGQGAPPDGTGAGPRARILNTQKSGSTWLHFVAGENLPKPGDEVLLRVDQPRRHAIQRHHTVTHLLHWVLHEVVSKEAAQKGSFVGPDKLTFDFNSAPLTPAQVADIERLVNERILENAGVSWTEVPYAEVKSRPDVMQFFGDKYGDTVRVVQIGGAAGELNGYSMELCGGTHTRATGEIGLFRILGESAIAAGVRRIEAVAGLTAYEVMRLDRELIQSVAGKVNSPVQELEKKIENLLAQQKALEKAVESAVQQKAANTAGELLTRAETVNGIPLITQNLGEASGDFLQAVADALKGRFNGVVVLGGTANGAVALLATVSPDFTSKANAGKLIKLMAPTIGGNGGGKPDNARGGGKDASRLDEALGMAKVVLE